jgi:putative ABC transport system ATP-binding protein
MLLKNVSVGLRQGELVALIGPSGSGKTELLQIMGGFLPADRGLVSVQGYVMPTNEAWRGRKRLNLEEEREHVRWRNRSIGFMTSDLNQLNPRMTALELITSAIEQAGIITDPRRRNEIAMERLQLVGLTDSEIPRLKPSELNRREKQLVALARALANDPPLLLADEPTGNLTSDSANYVFKLLQQFVASGKTIFMVTHDDYWARNASRQIEILDGEIVGGLA